MPRRSQDRMLEHQGINARGERPPWMQSLPVPVLTTLTPNTASIAGGAFPVAVNGSNFVPSSVVFADGAPMATTYSGPEDLSVAAMNPGPPARTIVVTVRNGPNISNSLNFTLTA